MFPINVLMQTIILAPILKLCQKNDPNLSECLRKAIETIRGNLTDGIPELLIPPCEPLKIPEIRIKQNAGAIRMESAYSNVSISGLSNFTMRDIRVDSKAGKFQADLWFPALKMTSNYLIHGKLLLMPISGSGNACGNFCKFWRFWYIFSYILLPLDKKWINSFSIFFSRYRCNHYNEKEGRLSERGD